MTDKNFDQMEMFAWWGVPTLFRCELERDPTKVEIGLIGVPHSSGNGWNERDQHFGPRALRDVSMGYRRFHREYKLSPWDQCRVRDMGDTPLPNAMHNDQTIKRSKTYKRFTCLWLQRALSPCRSVVTIPLRCRFCARW